MRKTIRMRLLILVLLFPVTLHSGDLSMYNGNHNQEIYRSFVQGDLAGWEGAMKELEVRYAETGDLHILYELLVAQYGYIGFRIKIHDTEGLLAVIEEARNNTQMLLKFREDWARIQALHGALYGLLIELEPQKTLLYGRRILAYNARALRNDATDPVVWMEKGNLEMNKPEIFGNDADLAIIAYKNAIGLFEESPGQAEGNWLYLNTMINLANAYQKVHEYSKASEMYYKVLSLAPGMDWLREEVIAFEASRGSRS